MLSSTGSHSLTRTMVIQCKSVASKLYSNILYTRRFAPQKPELSLQIRLILPEFLSPLKSLRKEANWDLVHFDKIFKFIESVRGKQIFDFHFDVQIDNLLVTCRVVLLRNSEGILRSVVRTSGNFGFI